MPRDSLRRCAVRPLPSTSVHVTQEIPARLLYAGDVPVESTVAGAALLYRLFDGYPAGRLVICQSDMAALRSPERRLRGVTYRQFSLGSTRLRHSRVAGFYGAFLLARSGIAAAALASQLHGVPDAVVTVAHGFSWLTAARLARHYGAPLHLIVHDDCLATMGIAAPLRGYAEARFGQVYRSAASRFCISPAMRDHYLARYGVGADVLYPSRAADARTYAAPSRRVQHGDSQFTVAFAGSLNVGHVTTMERLGKALERLGGRLEIYGVDPSPEVRSRLASPAISFHAFMGSGELAECLRERADALLVPMSFENLDSAAPELGFPSKLADYTALGIPLLIVGPEHCPAAQWASENPGVATVVTDIRAESLSNALHALAGDAPLRWRMAVEALRVGDLYFGHAQVQARFFSRIVASAASASARK